MYYLVNKLWPILAKKRRIIWKIEELKHWNLTEVVQKRQLTNTTAPDRRGDPPPANRSTEKSGDTRRTTTATIGKLNQQGRTHTASPLDPPSRRRSLRNPGNQLLRSGNTHHSHRTFRDYSSPPTKKTSKPHMKQKISGGSLLHIDGG